MKKVVALACLLVHSACALAVGLPPVPEENPYDLAISLGKRETRFDYTGGESSDTTLESIALSWYERFAPGFEIGLFAGKAFLTQTEHAATAGLEPEGHYVGLGVRGLFFPTAFIQPFVQLTYTYQRVKQDDNGRSITLTWYEPEARLGVATAPWNRLRVYGGATWGSIDGKERTGGGAASTVEFEREGRYGGFAGVDVMVEPEGYIGFEARSGTSRSGEVYFKKRF